MYITPRRNRIAQRVLAVSSFIAHYTLGLSILFRFGLVSEFPVWKVLADVWSGYGSPVLFLITGTLAAIGFCKRWALQWSLYTGAVGMWIWAFSTLAAWVLGYGEQPTFTWLFFVGILKWIVGFFWLGYEYQAAISQKQLETMERVSEKMAESVVRTQRGGSAGARSHDG